MRVSVAAWFVLVSLAAGCGSRSGALVVYDTGAVVDAGVTGDATTGAAPVSCAAASDCDDAHWCSLTGCGFTLGTCEPRPLACDGQWGPTCGCDGHTYDSPCHARLVGASIAAHFVPCVSSGCTPMCEHGTTCVDCGSAGPQCVAAGAGCAH